MKNIYVYRNAAIEYLFNDDKINFEFSSYGDINVPSKEYDAYLFFYIIPYKFDKDSLVLEIKNYYERLQYLIHMKPGSNYFVITLYQYFDSNLVYSDYSVIKEINGFNEKIYKLTENVKVIDINCFFNNINNDEIVDMKYYYLYNVIINPKYKKEFADFINNEIEKYSIYRKKCLVLDLDNTLWGGIIGEDGISNVKMSGDYPGNCFADFQKLILEMKKSGVILCVASKNNKEDVELLFETRNDIILKKEDFIIIDASWNTKDVTISNIAKRLNIGLSDIVFIDDNPVERELIKYSLPEVIVPDFPTEPYLLTKHFIKEFKKYFSIERLTIDDLNKTNQYKAKLKADDIKNDFKSIDEFIKSLNIQISFETINENNIVRIEELINKSNQFNLTTRRYTRSELENMKNNYMVYALHVEDKFDDLGIVGVAIVKLYKEIAEIDTFLISCRVIGRKIEYQFLDYILDILKNKGYKEVLAKYIKTPKNSLVKNFYRDAKFDIIEIKENEKVYKKELI